MKKISFWERLDIPESVVQKDEKLEQAITKIQGESQKTKKQQDELDERIWQASENFRRGQAIGAHNLPELHTEFMSLLHKKDSIMETPRREIEETIRERDTLAKPYWEEAITVLDIEYRKIMDRYILELPPFAQTPGGRELDHKGHRKNLESDVLVMTIRTNADAIVHAQELLVSFKARIVNAPSLKALKNYLDTLQKEYDDINWNPKEVEVEEKSFERLDVSKSKELAYLIGNTVYKVQEVRV